jgi:diguanylate cyclase (GGDEF)-like protein/putative nucleotidyltransferase with HDIG domain
VALERARLFDDVNESYDRTLDSLVAALDTRDNETQGHSQRVVAYTMALARAMDLRSEELHTIRRGALLHDIGKIGVPDAILHKPAPLTDEEWKTMRCHPQWGADILQGIPFLEPAVRILLAHHERWDGGGYPQGLAGEEIPLGARLFAVADAFDAMTSDRPYRAARSYEWAREEIVAGRGTQFDPAVVDAFLAIPKREWMLHASEAPGATSTAPSGLASAAFDRVSITRLASITQSLRSVSKSLDLEEVLDQTAQAAVDELGAAGSAVFVFDAESNTVSVGARKYFPEQLARHYKRVLAEGYPHSGTVREDGMQRLPDAQDGDRAEVNVEQAAATEKYGEYVCVPLHADDEVKGVLCALSPAAERFREDTIRMLEFIGLHAGAALDNASRHESMKHQAITDGLTGAYNRRYFDEFLSHEVRRCARYHHGVSILMLDIDTFKGYNDSAGHAAGDEVLRSAVELFRHQLRLVDLIARYGGEEFAMVLPETGPEGAREAAERVRNAFEERFAENTGLTISVGVSHCICGSDELTAQGLIERADRALYAAKRSGKNRVVLVDE